MGRKARERGLGAAAASLVKGRDKRRAFWDPLFRDIRQPWWWNGDDQPHPRAAASAGIVARREARGGSVRRDVRSRAAPVGRAGRADPHPEPAARLHRRGQLHRQPVGNGADVVAGLRVDCARPGRRARHADRRPRPHADRRAGRGARRGRARHPQRAVPDRRSPEAGPAPQSRMDVWDLDAIQMLWILRRMRDQRTYLDGRAIANPPRLFLGAAASPFGLEPPHPGAARIEEGARGRAVLPEQPRLRRRALRALPGRARSGRGAGARAVPRRHHPRAQRARGAGHDRSARHPHPAGPDRPPRTIVGPAGGGRADHPRDHRAGPAPPRRARRAHHGRRLGTDRAAPGA